jgi:hypothetical protein
VCPSITGALHSQQPCALRAVFSMPCVRWKWLQVARQWEEEGYVDPFLVKYSVKYSEVQSRVGICTSVVLQVARQWEEEGYRGQLRVPGLQVCRIIKSPVWGENGCRLRASGRRRAPVTLPALRSCTL